jgi:hypothetical protein
MRDDRQNTQYLLILQSGFGGFFFGAVQSGFFSFRFPSDCAATAHSVEEGGGLTMRWGVVGSVIREVLYSDN